MTKLNTERREHVRQLYHRHRGDLDLVAQALSIAATSVRVYISVSVPKEEREYEPTEPDDEILGGDCRVIDFTDSPIGRAFGSTYHYSPEGKVTLPCK